MAIYQYYREQKIPTTLEDIWEFISSPKNLQRITPPSMGFNITTKYLSEIMYPGMIISYQVSPLFNFKMTWVTEITQVKELAFFVDEQRVGPYKIWHHEHHIKEIEGGVLMSDLVTYQPPFGFIGSIANHLLIQKKITSIFDYREHALINLFGEFST
jgi:ligand-binding SRPBCC domain-containing protein